MVPHVHHMIIGRLDADRISSAIRISWGADTDIGQMSENLTSLFEVAKGLVF